MKEGFSIVHVITLLVGLVLTGCGGIAATDHPATPDPEVPRALAGIALGTPASAVTHHDTAVSALGMEGYLSAVVSGPGVVTHLVFEPLSLMVDGERQYVDGWSPEPALARLTEELGAPSREGEGWDEIRVWEADGRRLKARVVEDPGAEMAIRVTLHGDEPTRICGPEDGIADWRRGLEAAVEAGDAEAAADHFHFPFIDGQAAVLDAQSATRAGLERPLDLPDRARFVARFAELTGADLFEGLATVRSDCEPERGHELHLAYGPLRVSWRDGGLRAVEVPYYP